MAPEGDVRPQVLQQAQALIELGRSAEALAALGPLLGGEDGDALGLAAQATLGLHRFEEAAEFSRRFIAADPEAEWAYRLLSRALVGQAGHERGKRHDLTLNAAVAASKEAIRLAPTRSVVYRSDVDVRLANGDTLGAATSAARAVELEPNVAANWMAMNRVALRQGDKVAAERAARQAVALEPGRAETWNHLGVALGRSGQWRDAAGAYSTAASLDPVRSQAGGILILMGRRLLESLVALALSPLIFLPDGPAIYLGVTVLLLLVTNLWRRVDGWSLTVIRTVERLPPRSPTGQKVLTNGIFGLSIVIVVVFSIATGTLQAGGARVDLLFVALFLRVSSVRLGRIIAREVGRRSPT